MSALSSLVPAAGLELTLQRQFQAPRELVFRLWTDPVHLARWWGPKDFILEACETDVRPGGTWLRRMRAPDGRLWTKYGVYREIVRPERLAFTYATIDPEGESGPKTLVTLTFEAVGSGTRLILHQSGFETASDRDGHEGGWSSALERFTVYLAATSSEGA